MNIYIAYLLAFVFLWALVIVFHELGHIVAYYVAGYYPKLKWDKGVCLETETDPPNQIKKKILAVGIFCGIVPLMILIAITPNLYFQLFWVGFYFIGCEYDIKEIFRIRHNKRKKKQTDWGNIF